MSSILAFRASPLQLSTCGALFLLPWSMALATKPVNQRQSADPSGSIEIVNVSGDVNVSGWDQPEIEVTGIVGNDVERVDLTVSGSHATVRAVARSGVGWGDGNSAHLTIHVPVKSAVTATLVSSDLTVKNLLGDVKLQTVSGDVRGDVGGDLYATTVSGSVHLKAASAQVIEVKTVSGDMQISGGGGEVSITTISGDAKVDLASIKRGHFKSISGDLTAGFAMDAGGQLDGESVSGNLHFMFASTPAADFDVQTLSGDISNCFGPKPVESRYGPGSRLTFKNGEGDARVHIQSKSGDVQLCAKGARTDHGASLSPIDGSGGPAPYRAIFLALADRTRFRPVF